AKRPRRGVDLAGDQEQGVRQALAGADLERLEVLDLRLGPAAGADAAIDLVQVSTGLAASLIEQRAPVARRVRVQPLLAVHLGRDARAGAQQTRERGFERRAVALLRARSRAGQRLHLV